MTTKTLALCSIVIALAGARPAAAQTLDTEVTLMIGFAQRAEAGPAGVLVVPGTVIPISKLAPAAGESPDGSVVARSLDVAQGLQRALRLSDVYVAYRLEVPLEVGATKDLPAPTEHSDLNLRVRLLGFNEEAATYEVQLFDRSRPLADTRVAVVRGARGVVGGLDGDDAPYVFLVLEAPEAPRPGTVPPVKVSAGITPPRAVERVAPQYTEEARKRKVQGTVIVRVIINTGGEVESVKVLRGLPGGLSEAAVEAIRQWRFEPALDAAGKPLNVLYNLTINFRLEEEKEGAGDR